MLDLIVTASRDSTIRMWDLRVTAKRDASSGLPFIPHVACIPLAKGRPSKTDPIPKALGVAIMSTQPVIFSGADSDR